MHLHCDSGVLCRRRLGAGLLFILLAVLLLGAGPALASGNPILVNGEPLVLEAPSMVVEGRVFVPVRDLAEALQAKLVFYEDVAVTLSHGVHGITLRVNNPAALINGVTEMKEEIPFIEHDRIYIPLRLTAESLGFAVEWDAETQSVAITKEDPQVVTAALGELGAGEMTEAHVPYTDEEFELLARVINAEAYSEPFDGKVAVGNVVINRVLHPKFPSTIWDVLYAPNQFTVVFNGHINRQVRPDSYEAAREALYGVDRSQGALYFYNPRVSTSSFWQNRPVTVEIGNHRFTR